MPARRPDELTSRTPLSTDWVMITPTAGPTFKCAVSAIASSGVTSLNQLVGATAGALLTGAVVLKQGTNVTLSTTGQEITINSTAASGVTALNSLTGAVVLAAGTNVTLVPVGNTITVNSTAAGGVTSLNSLSGALNVVAGANITVTATGSSITIDGAASGGGAQARNTQTGTTYTLVLTDAQKLLTLNNAAAITVTIPTNASAAFPYGATATGIDFLQLGAGTVTFTPDTGVTLNGTPGLRTRAQYSGGTLLKVDINSWVIVGDTMV